MANADPPGARMLARMVKDAAITAQQKDQILITARRGVDMSCGDAIVNLGIMPESHLLKYLANLYRTNFVSTQKLSKATIDQRALAQVPLKVAERLAVCPILFDVANQALSVVTDNFEDDDVGKQVQMASGVREVKLYLARRAAVKTLIRKFYRGEQNAFLELQMRAEPVQQQAPPQQQGYGGGGAYDPNAGNAFTPGGFANQFAPDPLGYGQGDPSSIDAQYSSISLSVPAPFGMPGQPGTGSHPHPMPGGPPMPGSAPMPMPQQPATAEHPRDRRRSFTIEAPEIVAALKGEVAEIQAHEQAEPRVDAVPNSHYLETLNVLVALLENNRGELRGHSAQVARFSKKLCERIGLTESQMHGILVAAYLHDIGKTSNYHLTAFNVAQYEGHRVRAVKTHLTPLRMFESVNFPESTLKTLTHLYERFDGQGFPGRLGAKDIPLGARVVAIVETYVDLTSHDKNPARKTLDGKEAFEFMAQLKETVFDPNLLDLFQLVVLGDDLKAKLLSDRSRVLIVDADPEETTVLELRLVERGFDVVIARSAADALAKITETKPDIIICEVALTPMDGFQFISELKKKSISVPFIFLTGKSDRETVTRGFEIGAKDFVIKPASADVVAAKVQQVLSSSVNETKAAAGRGVTGTLQEMSLPDVIQILAHGRKSGTLEIRALGKVGELFMGEGNIWDARFGTQEGPDAVYAMLALTEGDFTLDLSRQPETRKIMESYESLLLEGMRRLDEHNR